MWENKAPPLMLVLLWHHFCYYKRNKGLLVISILLPIVLMAILMLLVWQLNIPNQGNFGKPLKVAPTEQQTVSFMSSGVLQYVQGGYSCYQDDTLSPDCSDDYVCSPSAMANPNYYSDRSLLDYALNGTSQCEQMDLTGLSCIDLNDTFYKYDPSLALMTGYIVYYPNQNATSDDDGYIANQIMQLIQEKLEMYGTFVTKSDLTTPLPDYKTIWDSLSIYAKLSHCWVDLSKRIIGFETRDDLIAFTQNNLDNSSLFINGDDSIPLLWGAINFDGTKDAFETKTFSYSLMKEPGSKDNSHKDIWLQDLIEEAAIKLFANISSSPISVMMKELPTKCWIKPSSFAFTIMINYIPIAVTIGFFLMPITFLILVIQEKYYRLSEYLSIMGVSDLMLKLSWIIFFLLFLIPLSFIVSLMIYYMPADVFADSDPSILFVIFVAFNISQLCWGYFLASVMASPAKVRFIIAFVNVFLSVFSFNSYNLAGGKITGAFLTILRILSLNASTPFNLALCYVINWESIWVGAHWKNFFDSPNKGDGYHGFGECIIWMLGDSVLYILLGWYFKHVMPTMYGIRYPPYFFVLPSYWCPTKKSAEGQEPIRESRSKADFEANTNHQVPGIVLNSLSKKYVGDRFAIDSLSLTFYKNEVTAFLGENGAGKSTTMNILVGLIGATSGSAMVNGFDVSTQYSEVRKLIGFVPQYDILYPDLTVEEHIQFYGWLKHLSTSQIWAKMDILLKKFGLEDHKKTVATKLSGGQKRKLSILSAYIGNPEVVILDEPTSGVDPFSRRSIWDMVNMNRKNTTTILSTHYMEEADVLGDRVAIISEGILKCAGSGMYLKNRYGQGYRITVATNNDSQQYFQEIENFMKHHIKETKLVNESGNDKTFAVPIEIAQGPKMIELLEDFEVSKEKLGVSSFGITEPTLEDVFFTVTGSKVKGSNEHPKNYGATFNRNGTVQKTNLNHLTGFNLWFTQFLALIQKRRWITFRQRSVVVMQVLLPMAFVAVMILISSGWTSTSSSQTNVDFYLSYRQNVLFFQDHDGVDQTHRLLNNASKYGLDPQHIYNSVQNPLPYPNSSNLTLNVNCPCKTYCDPSQATMYLSSLLPSNDLVYPLDSSANVSSWTVLANQTTHWVIGGFEFFQLPQTVYPLIDNISLDYNISESVLNLTTLDYVVIWTTPQLSAATLNAFNNLLIRSLGTDFTILSNTETASLISSSQNTNTQIISAISSATTCYFLIMAYIFATFGLADFLLTERLLGLKQLQFIAGANPVNYWCANLVWDFLQFAVSTAGTFLILGIFNNLFSNDLLNVFLIVLPFSFGSISFIYLLCFFLNNPGSLNRMLNLGALLFQGVASAVAVFNVISDENAYLCKETDTRQCSGVQTWITPVSSLLCLIPYYNLAESVTYISLVRTLASYNLAGSDDNVDGSDAFTNLLQFNLLGRRIMEAWIVAIILFVGVILMEYKRYTKFTFSKKEQKDATKEGRQKNRDSDVMQEENKVMSNSKLNDPLVVRKVVKFYPKQVRPAVNGVSFSIPRGQCFGLLGINGAGKTSLFRILSGMQAATSGTATIEGFSIEGDWNKIGQNMSYCPQENTLFFQLTTEQHLSLFGKLMGIKGEHLDMETKRLIQQVGLESQLGKIAFSLSGGNQRKLQFALALLDYRPLIFLDEPTTGMDPTARRQAWNSISDAIHQGCSVVLTSHSMEECEELCHRLVIMVLGSFSCIGSVQYLKDKFGNKYTFKVKLMPAYSDTMNVAQKIKEYVHQNLKDAVLMEEHNVLLVFEIAADNLKVSYLFKTLQDSVRYFPGMIEDFAISQISLEHVFINMAERQQVLDDLEKKAVA